MPLTEHWNIGVDTALANPDCIPLTTEVNISAFILNKMLFHQFLISQNTI